MKNLTVFLFLLILGAPLTLVQSAFATEFDRKSALDESLAAVGKQVPELTFFNSDGSRKQLADYRGKPLIISLIYTSCHHICPTTTKHLDKVVGKARSALGDNSFNVITVGFDTANDTADAMRIFARQQSVKANNWDFLAGDKNTIATLSKALGFQFYASPNGFDHLLQATLLNKDGIVYRQIYGMQFDTPHLVEPLKQLVFGGEEHQSLFQELGDKIRLFCTVYDPYSDSYLFDYSIFVGLFIGLTLGGFMLILLIREWRTSLGVGKQK